MDDKSRASLKYPIGIFQMPALIDAQQLESWIAKIEAFPRLLRLEVRGLTEAELQQSYRPEGWSIVQLVHHCADSHMNSFIRFKLALTEDTPQIKPYFEDLWARLPDAERFPIESSLQLLEGLHARWCQLLRSISDSDLQKGFIHPESNEMISLKRNIGIYAWHGEHHLAHIRIAKNKENS